MAADAPFPYALPSATMLGNPFGLDASCTAGIVSGLGRQMQSITGHTIRDVVQTDASINPGAGGKSMAGVAQCSMALCMTRSWCPDGGVVWCGVVWCGVAWCGVVWCGVVWCGVVWCGVAWCGVVWAGYPHAVKAVLFLTMQQATTTLPLSPHTHTLGYDTIRGVSFPGTSWLSHSSASHGFSLAQATAAGHCWTAGGASLG
jgi:hypothetical protein